MPALTESAQTGVVRFVPGAERDEGWFEELADAAGHTLSVVLATAATNDVLSRPGFPLDRLVARTRSGEQWVLVATPVPGQRLRYAADDIQRVLEEFAARGLPNDGVLTRGTASVVRADQFESGGFAWHVSPTGPPSAPEQPRTFLLAFHLFEGQTVRVGTADPGDDVGIAVEATVTDVIEGQRQRWTRGYLVVSATIATPGGKINENFVARLGQKLSATLATAPTDGRPLVIDLSGSGESVEFRCLLLPEPVGLTSPEGSGQTVQKMGVERQKVGPAGGAEPDHAAGLTHASLPPRWSRDIWDYEPVAMRFTTTQSLDAAIGLLITPGFLGVPYVTPGRMSLIVPKEAVPVFEAAGLSFTRHRVSKNNPPR